jgi:hypothetical protein
MGKNLFSTDKKTQSEPMNKGSGRNLFANTNSEPEEGFLQKLPRNIGAGLANLGHSELNIPHDIAQAAEDFGQNFGNSLNKSFPLPENFQQKLEQLPQKEQFKLSEHIPYQQDYDFAKMLGLQGEPTFADTLVQKGVEHSPEILASANALRSILPHLTKRGATNTLKQARQLASERNIGAFNVDPELIEDARQFIPKTLPYRNALDAAHYGDYDSLFRLQSDVGKHASDYSRSLFSAAERAHGREGLAARKRLLDAIHENLQSQGHQDISDLLKQGQNEYRKYMGFKPYRNALGVAAASLAIPKNPMTNLLKKLWLQSSQ